MAVLTTVELFSGIGGFRLACDSVGIQTIWANDNSTNSCKVYRSRFDPHELHEGDIQDLLPGIPRHDLLTAGFPCQPFSSAGKKKGIEDPRGTLFQYIVDIIREWQPTYFVLENVKRLLTMDRGKHFATILDALAALDYNIEWRLLNAMHFGLPQNRQRVFIIGVHSSVDGVDVRARLASGGELSNWGRQRDRSSCPPGHWIDISGHGTRFPIWGLARNGKFCGANLSDERDIKPTVLLRDVLQPAHEVGSQFDFTESTIERLEASTSVKKFVGGVEILSNQSGGARMGYTVFGINGVAPTLTCTQSRHYERYQVGKIFRRLTNVEYARIQGFPDEHCEVVTPYLQYSLYGNAVPPPMAAWAIKKVISAGSKMSVTDDYKQPDLFTRAS